MTMEKHWVEELFPPHYTYTVDAAGLASPAQEHASPGTTQRTDDDDRKLKHTQEIYDRVRIKLNLIQKEKGQKCIQVGEPLAEHLPQKSQDKECIWTTEELEILRKATQEAKEENLHLRAELSVITKQKEKLGRKCKRQVATVTTKDAEIHERKQEAERLSHHCHQLETELEHYRAIIKYMEEDVSELKESKHKLKKQLNDLRREHNAEKLTRAKISGALQQIEKKNALESIVREDGIRLNYERQVKSLYEELAEVRTELEKEKRENISARKALDHLRIHFASFPASNEQISNSRQGNSELGKLELY